MKTITFKLLAFLIILGGISSCSTDKNERYCFRSAYTAVKSVSGPDTTPVNTPITINVVYVPLGTCGKFKQFTETTTFPKEIKVLVDYEGCNCLPTEEERTLPYSFIATTAGEYVLKFLTADPSSPVTKKIIVTE